MGVKTICAEGKVGALEEIAYQLPTLSRLRGELPPPEPPPVQRKRIKFEYGDWIKDILGMHEHTWRSDFGWDYEALRFEKEKEKLQRDTEKQKIWVSEHVRRQALFAGSYELQTVAQLDAQIEAQSKEMVPLGSPHFRVIVYDPLNPKKTDIRALQAAPVNKNAVFQVPSSIYALPMKDMKYDLFVNFSGNDQGYLASIGVGGAALYRKYIRPSFRANSSPAYDYLFDELEKKGIVRREKNDRGVLLNIDFGSIQRYVYKPQDIKKVAVVICDNVLVTSGYAESSGLFTEQKVEQVGLDEDQRICQVLTTAYDATVARQKQVEGATWEQFARLALDASYEATLKAAYITKKPKVFLTLMQSWYNQNDPAWISEAIMRLESLINDYGLDVTLLFYPERNSTMYKPPIRSVHADSEFLKAMTKLVVDINKKQRVPVEDAINTYLEASYDNRSGDEISPSAQQINQALK